MDNRVIRIFNHLAVTLHFGKTSRAFHMSPSTLSRTIQRLEEEVGKPLFQRDSRSVQLTQAGKLFREYAEEVERKWNDLQKQLVDKQNLKGNISLYCSLTAAQTFLPTMLNIFRQQYGGIQLHLQTGDAADAMEKLYNGSVDIIIAALPEQVSPEVNSVAIATTPLVFVAPLHGVETVVWREGAIDWQETPLILAEKGLSRVRIEKWFEAQKITPKVYAQVAGNEALLAMVSLGFGVGVVPQLVVEKSLMRDDVVLLKDTPELAPFIIGVCTLKKKGENPLIRAFWQTVLSLHG